MDFFQCLLVILYITTLISGNTEITTKFQDIMIFSSAAGSWAFAENLCKENGYRLVTMKNKPKHNALFQYVSKNGISTSTGFWLGMTEEPSGSSSWFWSDASQVESESFLWKTEHPKPTVGQCVQINIFNESGTPASFEWESKACSDTDPRIICEKDTSSPCIYSDHNIPNVCPRSYFSLMAERKPESASSLDECQNICSNFQNGDYECWSLTFEPASPDTCVLYCYYSPFLLSEILSESVFAQSCNNTHFQHKTCFSAILDNRTLTSTTSTTATSETLTTTTQSTTNFPTSATSATSTTATSETLTTTTQSTTNFPTSANIPTTLATVTTTAEPITQFQTSATVEVPSMTSSPTTEMTSGSSTTTNELTSDSSATVVVSLSTTNKPTSSGVTTNKPTSSGITNSRPKPLYLHPCPVTRCLKNSSNETLIQSIQHLTQELTISPNSTSAARRKKTCAEDTRSSAAAVGVVGIIILSVIGFLVVIPDVMGLVIHLKSCLSRKE